MTRWDSSAPRRPRAADQAPSDGQVSPSVVPSLTHSARLCPVDQAKAGGLDLDPTRAYTLGRDAKNDLVLGSSFASSCHARLFIQGPGWSVEDLGSKNGVLVNGSRIAGTAPLREGDLLQIGREVFRFSSIPAATTQPAVVAPRRPPRRYWLAGMVLLGLLALAIPQLVPRPQVPAARSSLAPVSPLATGLTRGAPAPLETPAPQSPGQARAVFRDVFANRDQRLRLFWMAHAQRVLVLDYPRLGELGDALNRVALLVEEKGMPRDRVVTRDELGSYLRAQGISPGTFYYGHNYRSEHLARFFTLAERDGLALSPGEAELLQTLLAAGVLRRAGTGYHEVAAGAVLGVSGEQADDPTTPEPDLIDAGLRYAILLHELSHGVFFTDPDYFRYVMEFWNKTLREQEREAFRRYLDESHYDPGDEVMMANETQAYLIHTPDERVFAGEDVGLPPARLSELRALFRAGMPRSPLLEAVPPIDVVAADGLHRPAAPTPAPAH